MSNSSCSLMCAGVPDGDGDVPVAVWTHLAAAPAVLLAVYRQSSYGNAERCKSC